MTREAARGSTLEQYSLLGRSGLRVAPLALGTDTFGSGRHGIDEATARALFRRYVERGGNFVDTADMYQQGQSETWLGRFIHEAGNRDSIVLATKFTTNTRPGDPNAGGNGRKTILQAVEGSLRRLATNHIDLYWMHAWDTVTPVDEVVSTLADLVRSGKIRYFGFSNVPAWYVARAQSLAEQTGVPAIGLQMEYSLVERNIEREHVPAALELRLGMCAWSPLATGLLAGTYERDGAGVRGDGRLRHLAAEGDPIYQKFTERNWPIVKRLREVSCALGRPPAQVALNWITKRPAVVTAVVGARDVTQLDANLSALEFDMPDEQWRALDEVSRPEAIPLYGYFTRGRFQDAILGGAIVRREPPWFRSRR
jgi:aryl-alcohol dehydrogenase-like predicted oxidoreductase